jgi:hypothetical protein
MYASATSVEYLREAREIVHLTLQSVGQACFLIAHWTDYSR